jgi:TonB-dependent SusC/RagA subfamily outer membrane receptor
MKIKYLFTALLCLMIFQYQLPAQKASKNIEISGMVNDNSSNPVMNAQLTVDGKRVGNSTDKEGLFRIKVRSSSKTIGVYISSSIIIEDSINGKSEMEIIIPDIAHKILLEQTKIENDEEINIGYGTVKQKEISTVVNKADAKDYKFSNYSNIYDMISGKFPGVQVNGRSINVQGSRSFIENVSTEPLFVVDGRIVESIGDISPSQVNSIEVLKGAAAQIYGSRGANGVILITLRNGEDR